METGFQSVLVVFVVAPDGWQKCLECRRGVPTQRAVRLGNMPGKGDRKGLSLRRKEDQEMVTQISGHRRIGSSCADNSWNDRCLGDDADMVLH